MEEVLQVKIPKLMCARVTPRDTPMPLIHRLPSMLPKPLFRGMMGESLSAAKITSFSASELRKMSFVSDRQFLFDRHNYLLKVVLGMIKMTELINLPPCLSFS